MGSATMIAQNNIDLSGDIPSLTIGGETVNIDKITGDTFTVECKDSITIDEIVFAKNGTETKCAKIEKNGSTLLVKKCPNKLSFNKTRISLSPEDILTVSWGEKKWALCMKNAKSTNPCFYIIILVIIIGIGIAFKKYRKASPMPEEDAQKATSEDNPSTNGGKGEAVSNSQSEGMPIDQNEGCSETSVPSDNNDTEGTGDKEAVSVSRTTAEDKSTNSSSDSSANAEAGNLEQNGGSFAIEICEILGISGNDKSEEKIKEKIKELKQKQETSSESKGDGKFVEISEIEKLIKSKDVSKEIYNKETNGEFIARFEKLLKKLCSKVENSIGTNSIDDKIKVEKYIIEEKLKPKFGDYFLSNTSLESGLEKILEDAEKGRQATQTDANTEENSSSDFETFVKEIHSQCHEISDNVKTLDGLVNAINDLITNHQNVEKDITNSPENTGEEAITRFLKEVGMSPSASPEDAKRQIKDAIAEASELKRICKQYRTDSAEKLLDAVKEQIYKSIKGKLETKNEIKEIIANCRTTEGVVNELSEACIKAGLDKKNLKEKWQSMTTNLKEACANEGIKESVEGNNVNIMFKAYQNAVRQKIENEKTEKETLKQEVSDKQTAIEDYQGTFGKMLSEMKEVMSKDKDGIRASVVDGSFIRPCDIKLKPQCEQNHSLLRKAFQDFLNNLQATEAIDDYVEMYQKVQGIIEGDIANKCGLANVLSKYYSYSCLPFMTDRARVYGMRIDHESMMRAYNALNHLANRFGLQLIVPNLFADRLNDGEYNDCTGEEYGDLENFCPGVANYVQEISNSDKQGYITDLVMVGYRKENKVMQKAKVIVAQ